jgi:hypothetical protein
LKTAIAAPETSRESSTNNNISSGSFFATTPPTFPAGHFEGKRIQVLKGRYRGYKFQVHQSANDWITVVPPLRVRLHRARQGYIILRPDWVKVIGQKVSRSNPSERINGETKRVESRSV